MVGTLFGGTPEALPEIVALSDSFKVTISKKALVGWVAPDRCYCSELVAQGDAEEDSDPEEEEEEEEEEELLTGDVEESPTL